jgi:hypothetical protein
MGNCLSAAYSNVCIWVRRGRDEAILYKVFYDYILGSTIGPIC